MLPARVFDIAALTGRCESATDFRTPFLGALPCGAETAVRCPATASSQSLECIGIIGNASAQTHCSIARTVNQRVRLLQLSCFAPCMGALPWLALAGAAAPRGAKRICLLVFGFVACCAGCFSSLAGAAAPKKCEAYLPSGCWVGCWFVALGVMVF